MPNPVAAKYTVQLGPTVTPEVAGELAAWAEVQQRSVSEVARECLEWGLENLRRQWECVHGKLRSETLALHTEVAKARGEAQVARRRAYDERTRNAVVDEVEKALSGAGRPSKRAGRPKRKADAA